MTSLTNLLIFLGLWLLLWLPIGAVVIWRRSAPLAYPVPAEQKLPLLLPLYLVAPLAVWLFQRGWCQGQSLSHGLSWSLPFFSSIGVGLGLGLLGIALLVGLQWGLGWRRFPQKDSPIDNDGPSPTSQKRPWGLIIALLPLTLLIGGVEEWIFRGVVVDCLLDTLALGTVVVLSSGIFAVSHLVWDGVPGIPQLPGLWAMGAVLWLARWAMAGDLGLAIGLHAGWILGLAVIDTLQVLTADPQAPLWLAGRPNQPLTGLTDLALLGLTAAGIWWYSQGAGF
jgi:membrane protease YdiL (CAAX protease family)